jgi:hypothetical protein
LACNHFDQFQAILSTFRFYKKKSKIVVTPNLIFFVQCKISEPYDNPSGRKVSEAERKREEERERKKNSLMVDIKFCDSQRKRLLLFWLNYTRGRELHIS